MTISGPALLDYATRIWKFGWKSAIEIGRVKILLSLLGLAGLLTAIEGYFRDHAVGLLIVLFVVLFCGAGSLSLILLGFNRHKRRNSTPRSFTGDSDEWSIAELFFHIDPHLEYRRNDGDLLKAVGQVVLDALSSGKVATRGRHIHPRHGRLALEPVPREFWRAARFTYWFMDTNDTQTLQAENKENNVQYTDLRIDRSEALKVWPLPIPLREAAGKAYERTRGTEMSQTAEAHAKAGEKDGILNHYINSLFAYMRIVAQKPPSTIYEEISSAEKPSLRIWQLDDTFAVGNYGNREPIYLDPRIHLADLDAFVEDTKMTPERIIRL